MSVNSVGSSTSPPAFGPLLGNASQDSKFATIADQMQEQTVTEDGALIVKTPGGKVIGEEKDGVSLWAAGYANPFAVNQFKSQLSQALQADDEAGSSSSTGNSAAADGNGSPSAAALYKLINQIGSNDPSTAALLSSWNSMMQSGGDSGDAQSAGLQAFLQAEAPAFESGAISLSA